MEHLFNIMNEIEKGEWDSALKPSKEYEAEDFFSDSTFEAIERAEFSSFYEVYPVQKKYELNLDESVMAIAVLPRDQTNPHFLVVGEHSGGEKIFHGKTEDMFKKETSPEIFRRFFDKLAVHEGAKKIKEEGINSNSIDSSLLKDVLRYTEDEEALEKGVNYVIHNHSSFHISALLKNKNLPEYLLKKMVKTDRTYLRHIRMLLNHPNLSKEVLEILLEKKPKAIPDTVSRRGSVIPESVIIWWFNKVKSSDDIADKRLKFKNIANHHNTPQELVEYIRKEMGIGQWRSRNI